MVSPQLQTHVHALRPRTCGCNLTWKNGLCRCDYLMGPKSSDQWPREREGDTEGRSQRKMQQRLEGCGPKSPGTPGAPEAGRGRKDLPQSLRREQVASRTVRKDISVLPSPRPPQETDAGTLCLDMALLWRDQTSVSLDRADPALTEGLLCPQGGGCPHLSPFQTSTRWQEHGLGKRQVACVT